MSLVEKKEKEKEIRLLALLKRHCMQEKMISYPSIQKML